MNSQIVNNLYELWNCIGKLTKTISVNENYTSVTVEGSDWPYRVFDINPIDFALTLDEVIAKSQKKVLPQVITIDQPQLITPNEDLQFLMSQKNMALDMKDFSIEYKNNKNIIPVKTTTDAHHFADVASKSFGYRVDGEIINTIIQHEKIKAFLFQENNQSLGCGMLFVDASNNAGFHMIGTVPEGRGKGIGKHITERLLIEAEKHGCPNCVLHASAMGEPIYKKYGFEVFGELATCRVMQ
ncbi:GNAT family N-acetyltransferase [Flammeovirga aprica]|uniref:GNAT family N-acetyltransferase n=1 Tax=Flammeovirga aprica JL-4 TaxID=694437 RepID=A0A7X9RXV6_9BACT|nr:GNAT family N-acetyltransferase [Flammeovirga aprica]NME70757.1 GNAT family N-acetyltransferase [Flammeovirga aprica JL-4]